jgi:uncharacterized protein
MERLLNARGSLLEHARHANEALVAGRAPRLMAWRRFTGVVWEHLEPRTLGAGQLGRLVVPNAAYGLSRGTDAIADFRLSMSVSLSGLGNVARYWRPLVTDELLRISRGALVVDLLPQEHAAAVDFDALGAQRELLRVRFLGPDGTRAAGHGAKAVKGILARRVLERGPERLGAFRWEGWRATRTEGGLDVIAPSEG